MFFYGHSLLTYDRQQLMDILQSMSKPYGSPATHAELSNYCFYSPPKFPNPPGYQSWQIFDVTGKLRRRRRCGKRAGVAVRLKLALASGCPSHSVRVRYLLDTDCCLRISQRSLDSIMCIQPDLSDVPVWSFRRTSPRIRRIYVRSIVHARSNGICHGSGWSSLTPAPWSTKPSFVMILSFQTTWIFSV